MNLKLQEQDFLIDKLTESIENTITCERFTTEIACVSKTDLKKVNKKNNWLFNWKREFNEINRQVFKLYIFGNSNIIQGFISLEIKQDHVYIHLIESSPFNKGKSKIYNGVAGNLVAFACKFSFDNGHFGNVSFLSKTQLIDHYVESLGAFHFGGRIMIIETKAAIKLIDKYFKS